MPLHQLKPLRRLVIPLLRRFNPGDISIRHHYVGSRLRLHSFTHKGYWFHGRRREKETIALFYKLIQPGDVVLDVGAHIGYMTAIFAQLVGDHGRVFAFEPGENNLPYLRTNTETFQNVEIVPKAVSDTAGQATLYVEDLSGQNNSLVSNYEMLADNQQSAHVTATISEQSVETVRLDDFIADRAITPSLIKIDIEGGEREALLGLGRVLNEVRPIVMVEVTRNAKEVFDFLRGCDYSCYTPKLQELKQYTELEGNAFCLHASRREDVASVRHALQ